MTGAKHVQLVLAAAVVLVSSTASGAPLDPDGAVARQESTAGPLLGTTDRVPPRPVVLPPAGASTTEARLPPVPLTLRASGIPPRALTAYRAAALRLESESPRCRLTWPLLAGIGFVESGHGSVHGASVAADGRVLPPVLGPRLDGSGAFALMRDTDGGRLDGDPQLDRALGPMQFIPSTWARHGADGDRDRRADPHDLDDAAVAAARYLCFGARRLDRASGLIAAVFSYNHSYDYVRVVLTAAARYAGDPPAAWGVHLLPAPVAVPDASGSPAPAEAATAPATDAAASPGSEGPPETGTEPVAESTEPAPAPEPSPEPEAESPPEPEPTPEPEPEPEPSAEPEAPPPSSAPQARVPARSSGGRLP